VANDTDSILRIAALSKDEQLAYYKKYTDSIKAIKAAQLKKLKAKKARLLQEAGVFNPDTFSAKTTQEEGGLFYFYNPITVANGKLQFERIYGKRELKDNWKISSITEYVASDDIEEIIEEDYNIDEDPLFDPEVYVKRIPTEPKILDSLVVHRNEAYFQLGTI